MCACIVVINSHLLFHLRNQHVPCTHQSDRMHGKSTPPLSYVPSVHKVKTDVQKHVCIYISKNGDISAMKEQQSIFVFAVYLSCRWSSYRATTVRSASLVSLHNATLATVSLYNVT